MIVKNKCPDGQVGSFRTGLTDPENSQAYHPKEAEGTHPTLQKQGTELLKGQIPACLQPRVPWVCVYVRTSEIRYWWEKGGDRIREEGLGEPAVIALKTLTQTAVCSTHKDAENVSCHLLTHWVKGSGSCTWGILTNITTAENSVLGVGFAATIPSWLLGRGGGRRGVKRGPLLNCSAPFSSAAVEVSRRGRCSAPWRRHCTLRRIGHGVHFSSETELNLEILTQFLFNF